MVLKRTQYFLNRKYKALPHSIEWREKEKKDLKALINKEKIKKSLWSKIKKKPKKKAVSLDNKQIQTVVNILKFNKPNKINI